MGIYGPVKIVVVIHGTGASVNIGTHGDGCSRWGLAPSLHNQVGHHGVISGGHGNGLSRCGYISGIVI